jgi:hypothetical protein
MENISKYIDNKNFIQWVFDPNEELELWWKKFGAENPYEKRNIELARKVLSNFRTDDKWLSEEEKIRIFSGILYRIEQKQVTSKHARFIIGMLKYAAVAILFFAIGAMLFYKKDQINPLFYSYSFDEQGAVDQAKLIRSNGQNITLPGTRASIKYKKSGELVVNNDTLKQSNSRNEYSMNQLIIPYGKTSEILLPDGTNVILNAGSRLVFPDKFSGKSREVFLSGEAFFDVRHDSNHPFVVQLNDLKITDLGTRFNVSAYLSDPRVETVLTEGKVTINRNNSGIFDKATELIPGQMASYNKQTLQTDIHEVDVADYTLWKDGIIKFNSMELSRIVKKLERFYNIHFLFNDPQLETLRISGKLELNENTNEVVERIARTASVSITKNVDGAFEIAK